VREVGVGGPSCPALEMRGETSARNREHEIVAALSTAGDVPPNMPAAWPRSSQARSLLLVCLLNSSKEAADGDELPKKEQHLGKGDVGAF
jgi:hypothetical protein